MSKIIIKPSPTADSRTAKGDVTKEQLLESSEQHIEDVIRALFLFSGMLIRAGAEHDHTKLEEIDSFFDAFTNHKSDFKEHPWYKCHVTQERHHLNDHVPEDVNLLDVLERVADITMAGMGRSGDVWMEDLDPDVLQLAYRNTIELLKIYVEVEDEN